MDWEGKLLNELNNSFKKGIASGTKITSNSILNSIERLKKENYSSDFILKVIKSFCKEKVNEKELKGDHKNGN